MFTASSRTPRSRPPVTLKLDCSQVFLHLFFSRAVYRFPPFADREPCRSGYRYHKPECLNLTFVNGVTVGGGYVPDIVENPDGSNFTDPNDKVVVTDGYYAGLVLGGVTKTYNTTYKDSSGATLQDLTAGDYTILVSRPYPLALRPGYLREYHVRDHQYRTWHRTGPPITRMPASIMPSSTASVRIFDAFPGYFSDGGSNWSNFVARAYPNNGIEVVNDLSGTVLDTIAVANNTMFCTASIPPARRIGRTGPDPEYNLQDSANTTFLYYSNGEPYLTYNDTTGTPGILRPRSCPSPVQTGSRYPGRGPRPAPHELREPLRPERYNAADGVHRPVQRRHS